MALSRRRYAAIATQAPWGAGASSTDVRRGDLLAVYGELLSDSGPQSDPAPDLAASCRLMGGCWIRGILLDLGEFPGLVAGEGQVLGELYEVLDPSVFEALDRFQGYDARDAAGSEYVRMRMPLLEPQVSAWTYVYNGDPLGRPQVDSGDWRGHLADRFKLR